MDSPHCTVLHEVAMTRLWSCSWSEVPHCSHGPRCVYALLERVNTSVSPSTELSVSLRGQGRGQERTCLPKGDVLMGRMIQKKFSYIMREYPFQIYEKHTLVCPSLSYQTTHMMWSATASTSLVLLPETVGHTNMKAGSVTPER